MDILSTKKIDLSDFDLEGELEFQVAGVQRLTKYYKKIRDDKDSLEIELMVDFVKEHFVQGWIKRDGEKVEFESLGDVDMKIISQAFQEITGNISKKK